MKKRQRKLTFDIKDYDIGFPKEGVFISLEFLGLIKNNIFHSIESLSKQDKYQFAILNSGKHAIPNSYIKWALTSDWKKLDEIENGAYDNLNFGIEVEY